MVGPPRFFSLLWHMAALLAVALTALVLAAAACASGPEVYVATSGSDSAAGTANAPFATVSRALTAVSSGGTISIAPGTYAATRDLQQHAATVTLQGWNGRPTLSGLTLAGAANVQVEGIDFNGPVTITDDVYTHTIPTQHVRLSDIDVTAPGTTCVTVRNGARDITLSDSYVHDCGAGLGGPPATPNVDGIQILGNRFEHFTGDGVQFGSWDNVVFDRNVIHDMHDPNHVIHNDGIQFTGNSSHVQITNNVLYDSQGQLLLVQDSFGPIDDVLIQNNLIHDAEAYAVQLQGTPHLRFIGNTVWHSGFGGVLVRQGQRSGATTQVAPTDTVVRDNIVPALGTDGVAQLAVSTNNSLRCPTTSDAPCSDDRTFADVSVGDYDLRGGTPQLLAGVGYRAPSGDGTPPSSAPSPDPTPVSTPTPTPTSTPHPSSTPTPTPVAAQPTQPTPPKAPVASQTVVPVATSSAPAKTATRSNPARAASRKRGSHKRNRATARHKKRHVKHRHKKRHVKHRHGKRRVSAAKKHHVKHVWAARLSR